MRRGIGLISALIILVLVATLVAVIAKISFISVKHTSDTYLRERAELFMQSAIENAIMAIEGYDRSNGCLKHIEFKDEDNRFIAKIDVLRYYSDKDINGCDVVKIISTPFSRGYVLLRVEVTTNLANPKNDNKHIRLVKVTLQRA